ncbi:MAG: carbohydrate ABC transporter substrate-binding protein [Ruminococcus sp.]|nr:carbohydrate ABC transporter substrate-binding protein [Ruminococcus sp.]
MRSALKCLAALVCASAVTLSSGCGKRSVIQSKTIPTEISLSWWGNDVRHEYTIAAVERFEELHPDIKVNCSYSEWSGYESRSRVQMISNTEADVMQINYGWLSQYSPDGLGYYDISTLSDYIDLSAFDQSMLAYGKMNGRLNAIPIAMNAQTVYINKTIYDQYGLSLPQTWDDLFDAAKVMSRDGIYPMSGKTKSIWMYLITYTEQVCGKEFITNGHINFTADDFEVMLDMYDRMVDEKVIPPNELQVSDITKGLSAGAVAWVSDASSYCKDAIAAGYEIVPVPQTAVTADRSGEGWYTKPATMYAISRNTEHPQEAAMLLDFLLNSQDMAVLQGIEKGIPLSTSARGYLEEADMLSGIQYDASLVMEANQRISLLDPIIENSSMIDMFNDACNLVIYDKATSEEAARQLFDQIAEKFDIG